MNALTPTLKHGFDIAVAFIQREVTKRMRITAKAVNPMEIWASVTHDGRIMVGTPILRPGQGYYVNHDGTWRAA